MPSSRHRQSCTQMPPQGKASSSRTSGSAATASSAETMRRCSDDPAQGRVVELVGAREVVEDARDGAALRRIPDVRRAWRSMAGTNRWVTSHPRSAVPHHPGSGFLVTRCWKREAQ